ncbi:response regulator [Flavobacterium sp. HNIBRBA15423]|uniref:response regulator n=1 Tax=Flavobacterium sp. HNIBRBA15423 TaxID=3458683 RepID=UPI0040442A54
MKNKYMMKAYKTVIVDDHPMVISGISSLISEFEGIKVVRSFESGNELIEYLNKNQVDLIIMDIFLPEINGIDLCKSVKKIFPHIIILGMSSQSERSLVMQFIQNGGNGYFLKNVSLNELKKCIYDAIEGEIVFSEEVKKIISNPQANDLKKIPKLSRREKDILILLAEGKSTQEIADKLFISFLTVQTHRRNILNKYEVKNAAELINYALKNKLLEV